MLSRFSHVQLVVTPWTAAHQAPLSVEFSRQEYGSRLPFPPPGDLPDPGIKLDSKNKQKTPTKQKPLLKNGQRASIDNSPKKTLRTAQRYTKTCSTSLIRRKMQIHICKYTNAKPQRGVNSHLLGQQLQKIVKITSVDKDVNKSDHVYTLGRNAK